MALFYFSTFHCYILVLNTYDVLPQEVAGIPEAL